MNKDKLQQLAELEQLLTRPYATHKDVEEVIAEVLKLIETLRQDMAKNKGILVDSVKSLYG